MLYTINYILYGQTMGTVLPFLLFLIVIYDGVGTYNETITMDSYVVVVDDDDDGLCQPTFAFFIMSMPIRSNKNNDYTFVPSNYAFIGGGGK